LNIQCLIRVQAKKRGNCPAIIFGNITLNYNQLDRLISGFYIFLKKIQLPRGRRIALIVENDLESLITIFSLWRNKNSIFLLSPKWPLDAQIKILKKLRIKYLLNDNEDFCNSFLECGKSFYQNKKLLKTSIHLENTGKIGKLIKQFSPLQNNKFTNETFIFKEQAESNIILTSGSSGEPKGVIQTWKNHYYSALGANHHLAFDRDKSWLWSLPLNKIGGLSIIFRVFSAGGILIIPKNGLQNEIENDLKKK